jgi:hypothetical protein
MSFMKPLPGNARATASEIHEAGLYLQSPTRVAGAALRDLAAHERRDLDEPRLAAEIQPMASGVGCADILEERRGTAQLGGVVPRIEIRRRARAWVVFFAMSSPARRWSRARRDTGWPTPPPPPSRSTASPKRKRAAALATTAAQADRVAGAMALRVAWRDGHGS